MSQLKLPGRVRGCRWLPALGRKSRHSQNAATMIVTARNTAILTPRDPNSLM